MSEDLKVSTRHAGDVAIIDIIGDVTAMTGDAIEKAYTKLSEDGVTKFLLAFHKDCYINSGGIAILIGIVSESDGEAIRMTGLSDHFIKIFEMVGLTRYASVYPTVTAALENF